MRNVGVLGLVLLAAACAADAGGEDFVDSEADGDASELDAAAEALGGAADSPGTVDTTTDADGDGLSDALEEMMLRRYRPYYRWTSGEAYGPSNPVSELMNAQLKTYNVDGNGSSEPLSGCGRSGDQHLDPPESLFTCRTDTSMMVSASKSDYCVNLADARYRGVSLEEARTKATGFYGHVTPSKVNGHDAYQIEYWQFFAFNNQDVSLLGVDSFGDHEGDWTSVQLWYDRVERRLAKIRYLMHGREVTFTIPKVTSTCRNCTLDLRGPNYNPDPPNLLKEPEAYSDNAAQFFIDSTGYRHVVVYIERGGHEYWPGPWGYAAYTIGPIKLRLNSHAGDGLAYLVPDTSDHVFNLGEVEKPLTRSAKLMLWFNGLWGCTNTKELAIVGPHKMSPPGPALHCSWGASGNIVGCDH
jgi:hypothetical protein